MSKIKCSVCLQLFSGNQYYVQHFNYKKNAHCLLDFQLRLKGLSPKDEPATKRLKGSMCEPKVQKHSSDVHNLVRRPLDFGQCMTPNNLQPEHVDNEEPVNPDWNDEDSFFFPGEEAAHNPVPTTPPSQLSREAQLP